jgi:hypothetical protein
MRLKAIFQRFVNRPPIVRPARAQSQLRRGARLDLERLEDRTLPSSYTAASVSDLIADINTANQAGGANTITLAANTASDLLPATGVAAVGTDMPPVIAANDNLTIVGKGADTISGANAGRLFDVAAGAKLTLSNLTLSNAVANDGIGGGAIHNEGTLVLNGVNVLSNQCYGAPGGAIWSSGSVTLENGTLIQGNKVFGGATASGGGIWSSGTLTLQNATVQGNYAFAAQGEGPNGAGGTAFGGGIWSSGSLTLGSGTVIETNEAVGGGAVRVAGAPGGNAFGGGLYLAGGTANVTGATLDNNLALGGGGANSGGGGSVGRYIGDGGDGYGGGLYAAAGATVTLQGDTVESNTAYGGSGKHNGFGDGGGLFIAAHATVYLDAVTLANTLNNTADKHPDIDGSYVLQ